MGIIEPRAKNIRNCEKCFAAYSLNPDDGWWYSLGNKEAKTEGKCEFCK